MAQHTRPTSRHPARSHRLAAVRRAVGAVFETVERRTLMSAAGVLDSAFGTGGTVATPTGASDSTSPVVPAVAIQANEDLIVAQTVAGKPTVTRLTPSGAVDRTFGTNGSVPIGFTPTQVFVRADGQIELAGSSLELLTAAGSVVTTYGTNGVVTPTDAEGDAAVAPDGSTYVVEVDSSYSRAIVKYTAAGTADANYGDSGSVEVAGMQLLARYDNAGRTVVATDSAGNLDVAVGISNSNPFTTVGTTYGLAVYQLDARGYAASYDTFTSTDSVPLGSPAVAEAIAVGTDGTIAVAQASAYPPDNLIRVFDVHGVEHAADGTGGDEPLAVAVQPDGKVLAGGFHVTATGTQSQFVQRDEPSTATSDGGPDVTFGGTGRVTLTTAYHAPVVGLAVGTTGDVYVAGSSAGSDGATTDTVAALGSGPVSTASAALTGTVIGTAGSYRNQGNTAAHAFDGSTATFVDAAAASGSYAGLDFGTPQVVDQIAFAPRAGLADRMKGGTFQGSNDPAFATATTLYTVPATPGAGLTAVAVNSAGTAFRYVRYVGPTGGYGNIAEAQFFGRPAVAPPAAGTAGLANGVLTVNGTTGADTIAVDILGAAYDQFTVQVTINGRKQTLTGPMAHVVVNAGDGNDTVTVDGADQDVDDTVGPPDVSVGGGTGDDRLSFDIGDGNVTLDGGDGNDSFFAAGTTRAYVTMLGGAGDDTFAPDLDASCVVSGGAGTDTLMADGTYTTESIINLDGLPDSNPDGSPCTFDTDIENVTATYDRAAVVTGDASNNVITVSGSGFVTVHGGDGDDRITVTGGGPAQVFGDGGNDTLVGGAGSTTFSGGAGTDTVDYSGTTAGVTIHLDGSAPSGTAAQIANGTGDTIDGTVENAIGGHGNNVLYGTKGNNILGGGPGNDTFITMGGSDAVYGGDGNDTVYGDDGGPTYFDGGAGTDTAYIDPTGDTADRTETIIRRRGGKVVAPAKLTGTTFGTAGSYASSGNTIAKATDGNLSTFFDAPTANGDVVGLDLGAAHVVTQIQFAPRAGYASRMAGGVFQASNVADFSTAVVTMGTVSSAPPSGTLSTITVTDIQSYRYWRYVAPNGSYGDIAEFQVVGY